MKMIDRHSGATDIYTEDNVIEVTSSLTIPPCILRATLETWLGGTRLLEPLPATWSTPGLRVASKDGAPRSTRQAGDEATEDSAGAGDSAEGQVLIV